MKNFTLISAIILSLQFVNAQAAAGYKCRHFTGTIPVYPTYHETLGDLGLYYNADACSIVTAAKNKYFPDITLIDPYCFSSKFIGDLEGTPVVVTMNSGITQNDLAEYNLANSLPDVTAATAITINKLNGDINDYTLGKNLGTVYSQDEFLNPADAPREYMTVVGGSTLFDKGKLVIIGDAALGAEVEGRLCFQGN
jgi:hypothetical protein